MTSLFNRLSKFGDGVTVMFSVVLALVTTLAFILIVFQLAIACPACLVLPNANYLSWGMFVLILLSPAAYGISGLGRHFASMHRAMSPVKKVRYSLFVVAVALVASLSILRFMLDFNPQGSDTPNYLYVSNLVLEKSSPQVVLGDGRELAFLLLSAVRLVVETGFRQPFQLSMIAFPVILYNLLALATFQIVRSTTHDFVFATTSMTLSGLSFFMIRMSYDFYAQMFAISIMLLLFSSLLTMDSRRAGRLQLSWVAMLSAALILAHAYTWILAMIIWVVFVFISWFETGLLRVRATLMTFLPGLAYFSLVRMTSSIMVPLLPFQWYERTVATPSVFQGVLFLFQSGSFTPLNLSFLSDSTVGFENPLILAAAALGAYVLLRPRNGQELPRLLLSWIVAIVLLLLLGFSQQYRLIILLPIGILGGYSVAKVTHLRIHKIGTPLQVTRRSSRRISGGIVLLFLLIGSSFAVSVPKAYLPQYVYYPNQEGVRQLLLIKETFGFGNSKALVVVQDPDFAENSFQWARAITGANVYQGSIQDVIDGKPFLLAGVVPVRVDLSSIETVVIPSALYRIDEFEIGLNPRPWNGLYIFEAEVIAALASRS